MTFISKLVSYKINLIFVLYILWFGADLLTFQIPKEDNNLGAYDRLIHVYQGDCTKQDGINYKCQTDTFLSKFTGFF